ncbi:Uncharacterised protein [uncultured archaeon]|nr:Uncharacterised protein [uncultured archaeon]
MPWVSYNWISSPRGIFSFFSLKCAAVFLTSLVPRSMVSAYFSSSSATISRIVSSRSPNSGYSGKFLICISIISIRGSLIPRSFIRRSVRRSTSLARYPAFTFDGIMPSPSMNARHREWSVMAYTLSTGTMRAWSFSTVVPMVSATFFRNWRRFACPLMSITPANLAFCEKIFAYSGFSIECSMPARSMSSLTIFGNTASYMVGEPLDAHTNLSRP